MTLQQLKHNLGQHYCIDEHPLVANLSSKLIRSPQDIAKISSLAKQFSEDTLSHPSTNTNLHALLREFQLSSNEGLALMTLVESLLRIPDQAVAAQLIADRIRPLNWRDHLHRENPSLVNASTLLLMLTGKVLSTCNELELESYSHKLIRRLSQPFINQAIKQVIANISDQFVFAGNIQQALGKISDRQSTNELFSLDMLGESAICSTNADEFFERYQQAIKQIAQNQLQARSSVSIKLSALCPRYEFLQEQRCITELTEKLTDLIKLANESHVDLTIDAEEASRLELCLEIFSRLITVAPTQNISLGLAVQAYSPRALPQLEYLKHLAETSQKKLAIRLVKGAYWDSEIKQAQIDGLRHYPVFTHKCFTEISYLRCADFLMQNRQVFKPQFATHNPVTIADIIFSFPPDGSYEFQRLHGMGDTLYQAVVAAHPALKVRVYGPVGHYQELLPYLVRRLLENGANNSFLKRLLDAPEDLNLLCQHPLDTFKNLSSSSQKKLPRPPELYLPLRQNSMGYLLACKTERQRLEQELDAYSQHDWLSDVVMGDKETHHKLIEVLNPYNRRKIGECHSIDLLQARSYLDQAHKEAKEWRDTETKERVRYLNNFAQSLEQHRVEIISLLIQEAGKTVTDALNELREAIDFAYYYGNQALNLTTQVLLPGPTGEENILLNRGRGVFLCISPWNFPLAIFCGQICAALAGGNTVLAKPAESTPLIARLAIRLLHESGIPPSVLFFLPGKGQELCPELCLSPKLAGVAFTGSNQTATQINHTLAQRESGIIPFIAETGGQNTMLVDSSAHPEQLVRDVIQSAFYSAGQRCSALRVLYLQNEIFESTVKLLSAAMDELVIGDPAQLKTDIGPVISEQAQADLEHHITCMKSNHTFIHACESKTDPKANQIVMPHIFQISNIQDLKDEHFGPILHLISFDYGEIDSIISDINNYGFGLTCGIQSRNEAWAKKIADQLNVGNIYINRNMVGAIVGSQPFGGHGLSGTGPKAGGPNYLQRFMAETSLSNNISAIGGSIDLIAPPKIRSKGSHQYG